MVSTCTSPPDAPPPDAPPPPEPPEPDPLELSGVVIRFSSSKALKPLFIFSTFFAACPVLSAISAALPAASDQSSAKPPAEISNFHPKIDPNALVTVVAKAITFCMTALRVRTNGLKALISAPPIIAASCSNDCLRILTWFAHVSDVLAKSPCAAAVLAITY